MSAPRLSTVHKLIEAGWLLAVAVLAHPLYVPRYEWLLPELAAMGIEGFEVYDGDFAPEQRRALAKLAEPYAGFCAAVATTTP